VNDLPGMFVGFKGSHHSPEQCILFAWYYEWQNPTRGDVCYYRTISKNDIDIVYNQREWVAVTYYYSSIALQIGPTSAFVK